MPAKKSKVEECRRCGSCCDKGGPAFHIRDKALIENKIIAPKHVYTIRKGEPARDNVGEKIVFAKSDIIKIKGSGVSWRCVFMDAETRLCRIYENRPFECRILKCWDTVEIERSYSKNYLTREDLFYSVESLSELIEVHQKQCSYEKIRSFLKAAETKPDSSLNEVLKIIKRDAEIRSLVIEKTAEGFDLSELLFGRPLITTIRGFGLELVKSENGYLLSPRGPAK